MSFYLHRIQKSCASSIVALVVSLLMVSGASQAQTQVIVDDADATGVTFTGTWNSNSNTGQYGTSFRSDGDSGKGTKNVRFTPNLPVAGIYLVEAWWKEDDNRDNEVPFIVNSSQGTFTTLVNERYNGSQWRVIAQLPFAAGSNPTTGSLTISNTGTSDYVVADAVRWTLITTTEVVVDNDDSSNLLVTGAWTRTHNEDGFYSSSFLSDDNSGKGSKEVRFTPTFPVTGLYDVYAWWNAKANRATNVPFDIDSLQGAETFIRNQEVDGSQWNLLASRQFASGNNPATGSVTVRNTSTNGNVSADAIRWLLVTAAPTSAPTGLAATPGNAQAVLTWGAVSGATGYKLYRSTTSGQTGSATPIAVTGTTYTNTGLTNGTTYYYTLKATNAGGDGPASAQVSVAPVAPPSAPSGVTAVAGNAQVVLSWSAASGASNYDVVRSLSSGGTYTSVATALSVTSFTNTGLTNGTTYYYKVVANNAGGSTASAIVNATPVVPPSVPTGLTSTPGNAQIVLSWNAVSGATGYKLYRSTTSGQTGLATPIAVTGTTYTDTGLTNGTTYYYTLKATNAGGDSAATAQVSATPVAPPAAPVLQAPTISNAQVVLSWSAVSGATGYKLYRSTTSGQTGSATPIVVTGTTYTDTGLTNGTTYYYTLKATNVGGDSAASAQVSATPLAAPTGLIATPGNAQIVLSWNAVSGATGYKLYRSTTSGQTGSATPIAVTGTTYTNTGLTNGTTYYYTLKATNAGGDSVATAQVSATPVAPPAAPVLQTPTISNAQVVLTWSAVSGATSYKLYLSTASGQTGTATPVSVSGTTYTQTGLTNGTTYYFTLKASNVSGDSAASAQVSATPLDAPAGVTATSGNAQVALSWSAVTGATGYSLYRSTLSGGTVTLVAGGLTVTNYLDTGRTNGTTYYYTVKATNAGGSSNPSIEINATPLAPPSAVPSARILGISNSPYGPSYVQFALSWTASAVDGSNAATSYKVFRSIDGTSYTQIGLTYSGHFVDFPPSNIRCYYYVIAVNSIGDSLPSNIVDDIFYVYTPPDPTQNSVEWDAGTTIQSQGIAYPSAASVSYIPTQIVSGTIGRLNAFLATDKDIVARYEDDAWIYRQVSDPCTYTWTATAGTFVGSNAGQTVKWQAPVVATNTAVTISLIVDDSGGSNKGTGEGGSRNDNPKNSQNDNPVKFSTTVTVTP